MNYHFFFWLNFTKVFTPKGPVDNVSSSIQVLAITWTNGGPFIKRMHICHQASMS